MRTGIMIGAVALALSIAAPAAFADTEPNDGMTQAEGPLAGATTYDGELSTVNDTDWYSFYVAGQTQLDVTVTIPADGACTGFIDFGRMHLLDGDGNEIATADPGVNETQHMLYTTPPGVNRFYLVATDDACAGYKYSFRLDPGSGIVGGPGVVPPIATGEPNESAGQAFGPLAGGTPYAGRIDTQNDQDWFYFFTGGTANLDVALTGTADASCWANAALFASGQPDYSLASGEVHTNQVTHLVYTAPGAGKYLVQVQGCTGAAYQLRIDPASAIVMALPTPPHIGSPRPRPSSHCLAAQHDERRWSAAVHRALAKLHRTHARRLRRVLERKVAAERRTLRRARDRVTIYC